MEETSNAVLSGLSTDARRNDAEPTTTPTPRDKENAGANSTRHSQLTTADQPKSSTASAAPTGPPPARTPGRARLTDQTQNQIAASPSFFSFATTPSPGPGNNQSLPAAFKDASAASRQTKQQQPTTPAPAFPSLKSQKSPPGTSQVLRKHFQSLGFATTPPAKHTLHHHRLISSGAVRLTPNSRKKAHKGNHSSACRRIGVDGTKYTPSKELLKSTVSSRNQRVLNMKDCSVEHYPTTVGTEVEERNLHQQQLNQIQLGLDLMDDESLASAATMDDASFDMSLPSMNHPSSAMMNNSSNNSHVIPAPHSPLTPRMGCLNPVALTLLNDGKEDYNYLLTQDALYPIPKVEDTTEALGQQPTKTSSSSSSSSSPPSACLSPTQSFGQSPAEVRATLSHTKKSTLARPVAIMAKTGRSSPSQPRLMMRPQQANHVR